MKYSIQFWILPLTLGTFLFFGCQNQSGDESEIRSYLNSFAEVFNQNDPKALGNFWAEDGENINLRTDSSIVGREAIVEQYQNLFDESGKLQIEVQIESIQFEGSDQALAKGITTIQYPDGEVQEADFELELVRENGDWRLYRLADLDIEQPTTNYENLKALEWLVGSWVDGDEVAQVQSTYSWDKYKNFLTQKFIVQALGKEEIEGRQVIAWDPTTESIRSWIFDSDGGFGEGKWRQKGPYWIVETVFTLPDGRLASAIHIYKKINDDSFTYESTGREVGGEILPNVEPVTIVRQKGNGGVK